MSVIFPAQITTASVSAVLPAGRVSSVTLPAGFPAPSGAFASDSSPGPIVYLGPGRGSGTIDVEATVAGTYTIWAYSAP